MHEVLGSNSAAGHITMLFTQICGVSILRAGETLEPALCEVCKDIRIGKMLIQTNMNTGEPEVILLPIHEFNTSVHFIESRLIVYSNYIFSSYFHKCSQQTSNNNII